MKKLLLLFVSLFSAGFVMADNIPVHIVNPSWNSSVGPKGGTWEVAGYSADSSYWVGLFNYNDVKQVAGTYTTYDMDDILSFLFDNANTGTALQTFSDLTVKIDSIDGKFNISAVYSTWAGMTYDITFDPITADNTQNLGGETGIHNLKSNAIDNSHKAIIDGKVVILREGKRYLLNGQTEANPSR